MEKINSSFDSQKKTPVVFLRKSPFKDRDSLPSLLRIEPAFKIQIFSLESIEIFEDFLHANKITFTRAFASSIPSFCPDILLILQDAPFVSSFPRVLLYSNSRNFSFIPYQFNLSSSEKEYLCLSRKVTPEQRALVCAAHSGAVSRSLTAPLRLAEATADSLTYVQCVIVMSLAKAKRLRDIWKEVKDVDPEIGGMTVVRAELNWLCKHRFCIKSGDLFKLCISPEAQRLICEKIGFITG